MHELSVTKNLIGLVVEECSSNGIKQPSKIIVELGELTNYKKDPIIFYFDIMKKETPCLVNAELEVIETKGKIRCRDCYKESHIKENYLIFCPVCKSLKVDILQGREFNLKSIEGE